MNTKPLATIINSNSEVSTLQNRALKGMGQRLKKYRLQRNLTQKQVSKMLDIDEQYYGQAERGVKRLSLEKLVVFCFHFQLTLDDVIQIRMETEFPSLKETSIKEITLLLENCSSGQLALIQSLLKNMELFKKD